MNQSDDKQVSILGIIIWSLAALFFLYEFFLRTFLGTVSDEVITALKLSSEQFSLIGSAYYFAYAAMQLPVGVLADRFGVKRLLIFATITCALGVLGFSYAGHFVTAMISRLLMGFGSSFAFVCLLALAINWFPQRFFGFFSGASQFLGAMGPVLAGGPLALLLYLTDDRWRLVLFYTAVFGFILTALIFFVVRDKPKNQAAQKTVVLKRPSSLTQDLKKLAGNPQVWLIAIYAGTIYASLALLGALWGPAYLQARGLSQQSAASVVSIIWIGLAVGCPLLGAVSDMIKRRKMILLLSALLGLVATLLIIYLPITNLVFLSILFFSLGFAGAGQSLSFATMADHVQSNLRASALGINNTFLMAMGGIVPAISGVFINPSLIVNGKSIYQVSDFTFGFLIMPLLFSIGLVVALFGIRESYCRPQKEPVYVEVGRVN